MNVFAAIDHRISLMAMTAVTALTAIEIAEDGLSTAVVVTGAFESALLVVPAIGLLVLYRRVVEQRADTARLMSSLETARDEGAEWRRRTRELMQGLGEAIDTELVEWQLTEAEREIALLLLKGLSHKEIAALRGSSERTVRQQSRAVYAKSGLSGRTALSAYFLEDLLPPRYARTG